MRSAEFCGNGDLVRTLASSRGGSRAPVHETRGVGWVWESDGVSCKVRARTAHAPHPMRGPACRVLSVFETGSARTPLWIAPLLPSSCTMNHRMIRRHYPLLFIALVVFVFAGCNEERAPAGTDGDVNIIGDDVQGDANFPGDIDPSLPDLDPFDDTREPDLDVPPPPPEIWDILVDVDPPEVDTGDVDEDTIMIPPGCGDGVLDPGEQCDEGADNGSETCRIDCTIPRCGDGVLDPGEACDDGAANSDIEPDRCRTDCTLPRCGDGVVDEGELCDDGNDIDNDACSNTCVPVLPDLCAPCTSDDECGRDVDLCSTLNEGRFCTIYCTSDLECPSEFYCDEGLNLGADGGQCVLPFRACVECLDRDGDGYGIGPGCLGLDCDDTDASINPGADEVCDGRDNNCDGRIDVGAVDGRPFYRDFDGDGFGDPESSILACGPTPSHPVENGDDCDDTDPTVYPGAPELCDGRDNNCNGVIDEGGVCAGEPCCYLDRCAGVCATARTDESGACVAPENYRADEVCDGLDNTCDGRVDVGATDAPTWYFDGDRDGYGDSSTARTQCRAPGPRWVTQGGDCDDTDPSVYPGAPERCDGQDNNCNGEIDEGGVCAGEPCCYLDLCVGVCGGARTGADGSCLEPEGYGREVCDGLDNDCDGVVDNDATDATVWYRDGDGDGFGGTETQRACASPGAAWVTVGGDCDDTDASIYPGAPEICDDGVDNNCSGSVDCDDPLCTRDPVCDGAPTCPERDLGRAVGVAVATGTTRGVSDDHAGTCGGAGGGDVALRWTSPADATYRFGLAGSNYPAVVYVRQGGCDGPELGCGAPPAGPGAAFVDVDLPRDTAVVIFIDGNGTRGDYVLGIQPREFGYCDDGIDNDNDGLTDCADPDCELDEACCPDDIFEPNQGTAEAPSTTYAAYLANADAVLTVKSGDPDFFNLPVCAGAVVSARAQFIHADGNIDMRLRVQTGQIVASATSTTNNEALTYTVPNLGPVTPTNLFLEIFMNEADRCNEYTLTITITGCAP